MRTDGPNPYVLMAIFHRLHEWQKEQADHVVQVKALEMRKAVSSQRSAVSGQRSVVSKRKAVAK